MKTKHTAALLLAIQLLLVLSIAAKYLYERRTRPRIWVRATQYDPSQPLRGRYLALQLTIDACSLPRDAAHYQRFGPPEGLWTWDTVLSAQDGKLTAKLDAGPRSVSDLSRVTLPENRACNIGALGDPLEYFIPEHARTPFPLKSAQELWVEVTLPSEGPPRPIQLALADSFGFHPLHLD